MDWKLALKIGIFQCLAMIPGTSRAAATIMSARVFGADRATAAEFSFFLAMPTMLGAAVYDTFKNRESLSADAGGILLIVIGFGLAFVTAMLVVRALIGFVSRYGFGVFAWYRIMLGSVALVLLGNAGSIQFALVAVMAVSALAATQYNQSETARRLGLNRATLYDRLKKYSLLPDQTRESFWNDYFFPGDIGRKDAAGNIYVADQGNHRIQKFSGTGDYLTQWGSLGTGNGQLNSPNSVASDAAGNISAPVCLGESSFSVSTHTSAKAAAPR